MSRTKRQRYAGIIMAGYASLLFRKIYQQVIYSWGLRLREYTQKDTKFHGAILQLPRHQRMTEIDIPPLLTDESD